MMSLNTKSHSQPATQGGPSSTVGELQTTVDLSMLPPEMVVAIDGVSTITRKPIGELVAQALGAVLADSGRFYRSLTKSCLEASLDLTDFTAVSRHCQEARLDVWVRPTGGPVDEALVFVNGDLFNHDELAAVHADTVKVAVTPGARHQVMGALRQLERGRRLVVLGRDIADKVFPWTPFRIYVAPPARPLNAPKQEPDRPDLGDLFHQHPTPTIPVRLLDAIFIDADETSPAQACARILAELPQQFRRRQELELARSGEPTWTNVQ